MRVPRQAHRGTFPNLGHLRLVDLCARLGSISAAARTAHLSQPAATLAVAAIEADFGIDLFERGPAGVTHARLAREPLERIGRALAILREAAAVFGTPIATVRDGRSDPLRGITSAQLQALMTVCDSGSFAKAARHLGVTRAATHRGVRQLEEALGAKLVERSGQSLHATHDGQRLALRARLALAEIQQGRAEAAAAAGQTGGFTIVGAMPLARSIIVPDAVLAFTAERPEHMVEIMDGPYQSLLHCLRHCSADVLIGALRHPLPAEDVVQEHLFDDPLAIVMRTDHPLASSQHLRPSDFAAFPWIAPRSESPLRLHFDALSAGLGTQATPRPIQCNTLDAARTLLLSSNRLMLLSAHQIHHERVTGQLLAVPHPFGPVTRPIGLTMRRNWRPTAAQQLFLDVLRATARLHGSAV